MRRSMWLMLAPMLSAGACSGAMSSPVPTEPVTIERCGDVEGTWSSVVDGLRARIITSGSLPDGSALRVEVELENVSAEPLAIHWDGRPSLGFVSFRLDDDAGAEVPEPEWRLGGNEPGGSLREVIPASGTVRHALGGVLDRFQGARILRIGAFWAREMPSDGSRWFLRGRAIGRVPSPGDLLVSVSESGEVRVDGASAEPRARAWTGPLELPPVCID